MDDLAVAYQGQERSPETARVTASGENLLIQTSDREWRLWDQPKAPDLRFELLLSTGNGHQALAPLTG